MTHIDMLMGPPHWYIFEPCILLPVNEKLGSPVLEINSNNDFSKKKKRKQ